MSLSSTAILTLKSLKIGYVSGRKKNFLISPLNAVADKGELVSVIGLNGIGKSTLLRTITGLQPILGGEILYNGVNLLAYSKVDLAKMVGYISTEVVKISNMTVEDLVTLGRFPYTNWTGKIDKENNKAIIEAMDNTSMSCFRNRFVNELSDGERQRAMIARLLAQDTPVMVMDEPTAFLDIGSRYEILNLMTRLAHDNGKTIIFSTHDLQMAISQSDKIWLILGDKLIEGAPEDLLLTGEFDHLFDKSQVQFNSEDGTFSFNIRERGTVYLEGEGKLRYWTEKALNRAGYLVTENKSGLYLKIIVGKIISYQLTTGESVSNFSSLYELNKFISS